MSLFSSNVNSLHADILSLCTHFWPEPSSLRIRPDRFLLIDFEVMLHLRPGRLSASSSSNPHQISVFNLPENLWRVDATLWGVWIIIPAAWISLWMNPAVLQKYDLYSNPQPNCCTTTVLHMHIKRSPKTSKIWFTMRKYLRSDVYGQPAGGDKQDPGWKLLQSGTLMKSAEGGSS